MTQNRSSNIYRLSRKVIFQWVPSYVGLEGNEIADKLAKKKRVLLYIPKKHPHKWTH
jgi:ribonuclease HI